MHTRALNFPQQVVGDCASSVFHCAPVFWRLEQRWTSIVWSRGELGQVTIYFCLKQTAQYKRIHNGDSSEVRWWWTRMWNMMTADPSFKFFFILVWVVLEVASAKRMIDPVTFRGQEATISHSRIGQLLSTCSTVVKRNAGVQCTALGVNNERAKYWYLDVLRFMSKRGP